MKKLFFLFFLFLSSLSFGGIITIDFGGSQDFLDYEGGIKKKTFTPFFGFSVGGKEPGWHMRLRISGGYRDFNLSNEQGFEKDISSTLRMILGPQWIFESDSNLFFFVYAGLEYRETEAKYKVTYSSYWYDYLFFRRFSIPVSLGMFYRMDPFVLSIEGEAGVIPLYSMYHKKINGTSPVWYNEFNFAVYTNIGIVY
ncbi:MAG TPA: hypothetical protein DHW82_00685 [Spirochaetia bacterium]|nr:MAG: hypothetical protein A2Y41_13450 [Spirochaetes bacterium GWB1_36_13]HCL55515.1 hypothetical protein [Spirochaetia bacterium]